MSSSDESMDTTNELSRLRRSVTTKRSQIMDQMRDKRNVGKKQCQQWIDEICDLVVNHDTQSPARVGPPIVPVFITAGVDTQSESRRRSDEMWDQLLRVADKAVEDSKDSEQVATHHDILVYTCDTCKRHLVETRYHCTQCEDFDLCVGCYEGDGHSHAVNRLQFGDRVWKPVAITPPEDSSLDVAEEVVVSHRPDTGTDDSIWDASGSANPEFDWSDPQSDYYWDPIKTSFKKSVTSAAVGVKKPEVRYKGVIRGMDWLADTHDTTDFDDNWEPIVTPAKTTTAEDESRGGGSAANVWQSEGKVLGGGDGGGGPALTGDEMRQLMAQKTEQRLRQMDKRGAKGVVRLPAPEREATARDDRRPLRWQL